MPMFDLACQCGWSRVDTFVLRRDELPPCPVCSAPTEKQWATSFPNVIDDTIIGGEYVENLSPTGETFYSKSEKRRWLKEHGFRPKVQHMGTPGEGSDKSDKTTRWY